ncbi:MAG: capsule assembly Wzi family protein, partial [Muribaculaceae bacterium]|nr:capsule assembly Wzi family protein [Muribaculaceae bacterium]
VKYHSKGLWLRNGNPDKFPLTFEAGIEMATQFGGGGWFKDDKGNIHWVKGAGGLKGLWHAFVPQSGGDVDAERFNVEGNFLGNWTFALAWTPKDKDWSVKAYYQHLFDDHSMLYIEYPWRDGLWGVEGKLPHNPFVSRIVYEFLYMKDQTGPVYWDHTDKLDIQVSGRDNYYEHMIYGAWQHWGMIIGNPMILSPLYNNGNLLTLSSRIIGHHLGFEGEPTPTLSYRVLASYQRSRGTYKNPLPEVADSFNLLAEVSWHPRRFAGYSGWEGKASFGLDAGDLIGRSVGLQISIIKHGKFTF